MKLDRCLRYAAGGLVALTVFISAEAVAGDNRLLGCWRVDQTTYHARNADPMVVRPDCLVLYRAGSSITECRASKASKSAVRFTRLESSYTLTVPGTYTSTVTQHSALPDMVGTTNHVSYRIDGGRLTLETRPSAPLRNGAPEIESIETVLSRVMEGDGGLGDQACPS